MSEISFKCPDCHSDLVVSSSVEIKEIDDLNGTKCTSCGRAISKEDITAQASDYAANMIRDAFRKHGL
ncbi:ECs_2282 family putative zinc-binding protein [Xenorhabdus stockiae]|uniref:ECs_2282 family putative zinc-binding protein n=1 Tax=Xenorhabdus stockiae TaxID=351614 RepID=UPI003BB507FC